MPRSQNAHVANQIAEKAKILFRTARKKINNFLFFQFYKVYNYQFIVEPDGTGTDIGVQQVNCFDWEDVCAKENVKLYPTLRFYRLVLSLL